MEVMAIYTKMNYEIYNIKMNINGLFINGVLFIK